MGLVTHAGLKLRGFAGVGTPIEYTIATGVITVTNSNVNVDTQSDASSDDLDTINGTSDGKLYVLSAANSARTVVVKHGTGNILLDGQADFSLTHVRDKLFLISRAGVLHAIGPGSSNGA